MFDASYTPSHPKLVLLPQYQGQSLLDLSVVLLPLAPVNGHQYLQQIDQSGCEQREEALLLSFYRALLSRVG